MRGAVPALVLLLLPACCSSLKIGFVGDTSDKTTAAEAYKLMRDAGAEIVLQNGDLDYVGNPGRWAAFLNTNWFGHGKEHVLMTSGNHDLGKWGGTWGYQRRLFDTMNQELRDSCTGADHGPLQQKDYGLWMSCKFQGVHVVMVGWREGRSSASADFIDAAFTGNPGGGFKVCMWHRPEGVLQAGNRYPRNRGMIPSYEACRRHGAFIVSGHNHLYSRTKLLSSYSTRAVSPRNSETDVQLSCGESMFIVSGLGGWARGLDGDGPSATANWMQKRYTQTVGTENIGALVCDLPVSGLGGSCQYLLGQNATVYDSFSISSTCGRTQELTPVPATPEPTFAPSTPAPTPVPSTPEPTSAPVSSTTPAEVGCFHSRRGNTMKLVTSSRAGNTVEGCSSECASKGFRYAGLRGSECWCGERLPTHRQRAGTCDMSCTGNSEQVCGAAKRLSVFAVDGSKWNAVPAHKEKGCFVDQRSPRVMTFAFVDWTEELTVERCVEACAYGGHKQAGLQKGKECWCGSDIVAEASPSSRCSNPCPGNTVQFCGGSWRLSVFDIGQPVASPGA